MNARRVDGQPGHPGLVAEDAAAGAGRGGVDREHGDPVTGGGELVPKRVDERGLADAWHAGDADAGGLRRRTARAATQQLLRQRPVVGAVDSTRVIARARSAREPARTRRPTATSGRGGAGSAMVRATSARGAVAAVGAEQSAAASAMTVPGREDRRGAGGAQLVEVLGRDRPRPRRS